LKSILLIDDDEFLTTMMVRYFRDKGYSVQGCTEAKDALNSLSETHFDIIVTDIVMPDMDGIELIIKIREMNKDIPVIAMSGGGRLDPKDYLNLASQLGANFTLAKPFHLDTLQTLIESLFEDSSN